MARPGKDGLEYFSLDTKLDDNFELLEGKYGLEGFAIVIKMYQKIYAETGYYHPWNEREQLLFATRINVDINRVNAVINYALELGIFSEEKYKLGVLTSRGIQKRYLIGTARRKKVPMHEALLLVNVCDNPSSVVLTAYINPCSVAVNVYSNPHIDIDIDIEKEKEKILKEGSAIPLAENRPEPEETPIPEEYRAMLTRTYEKQADPPEREIKGTEVPPEFMEMWERKYGSKKDQNPETVDEPPTVDYDDDDAPSGAYGENPEYCEPSKEPDLVEAEQRRQAKVLERKGIPKAATIEELEARRAAATSKLERDDLLFQIEKLQQNRPLAAPVEDPPLDLF